MNQLFFVLLQSLYFFVPAYFANMTPPLVKWLKLAQNLDTPIDANKKYSDGKPILGSHKTWRGLILGIFVGALFYLLQINLYIFPFFKEISLFDYTNTDYAMFAFLLPFGALFGDAFFSFLKRRLDMKPGQNWMLFDQTDYVFGVFAVLIPFKLLFKTVPANVWVMLFITTIFLHLATNILGYKLKIKDTWW